jgi:protein-disulfide isomerase
MATKKPSLRELLYDRIAAHFLFKAAKLAADRGDMHRYLHRLDALMSADDDHGICPGLSKRTMEDLYERRSDLLFPAMEMRGKVLDGAP